MADEHLYLRHRTDIEAAIRDVCRLKRLSSAEADDFASTVRLHVCERDAAVLRAFQQRSTFRTFIHTVVLRQYQDWRNSLWGKWRPSEAAKRLGPVAIRLEELVMRDGVEFDRAVDLLRARWGADEPRATFEAWLTGFPVRTKRVMVEAGGLDDRPASASRPDELVAAQESADLAMRARTLIGTTLDAMPAEDQLLLRLVAEQGLAVTQAAVVLNRRREELFRVHYRFVDRLKQAFARAGFTHAQARLVLEHRGFDVADDRRAESAADVRPLWKRRPTISRPGAS